jgi:hypothetical protein
LGWELSVGGWEFFLSWNLRHIDKSLNPINPKNPNSHNDAMLPGFWANTNKRANTQVRPYIICENGVNLIHSNKRAITQDRRYVKEFRINGNGF